MSVKFKESTQWYKIFHVATTAYYKNVTKNIDNFNIYERNYLENNFKHMHNSIGIISCEKLCLELPLETPSFPL